MKKESKIKEFFEDIWFYLVDFKKNWIWPAYSLKNLLFHRYDLVKLPIIKRTEYSDTLNRLMLANFELIKQFIEEEKPEEHVLWYKDDEGNDVGHKYGMTPDGKEKWDVLYPELQGEFIMDIIKDIYNWYTVEMKKEEDELAYILNYWCTLKGTIKWVKCDNCELCTMEFDSFSSPKTIDDIEKAGFDFTILDKIADGDRNSLLNEDFVFKKYHEMEDAHEKKIQQYLHLCIEVRPYLWT